MLKIATSDTSALIVIPELTQPTVYLDYGVIADLACDSVTGEEFRDCLLKKGGTLYLSWAHLVELFGLGSGPTYNCIRSYLALFGRSFVLIDSDAQAVIRREKEMSPGKQNPVIDEEFLRCLVANWSGMAELDVGFLLDAVGNDPSFFPKLQVMHRGHKDTLKKAFDDARDLYHEDREARRKLDGARYYYVAGTPPTEYLYKQITRECVMTNEQFNASDGLDFEHCVVPLSYCDFVVLDKKWARRCKKITIPSTAAKVFSGLQVDHLVHEIKLWPPK